MARADEIDVLVDIDEDAGALYAEGGLPIELAPDCPFLVSEQARWLRELERQQVFLAVDERDRGLGFAALDVLDGEPYLEQLSVRRGAMRRGIGRQLLQRAFAWAEAQPGDSLWLTTYGHLTWNRPFYEREGFRLVPEGEWPPDVAHHVADQRRWLPAPEQRVAMRRPIRRRVRR
jgi:GNAT superfamily N-acetyltransferase